MKDAVLMESVQAVYDRNMAKVDHDSLAYFRSISRRDEDSKVGGAGTQLKVTGQSTGTVTKRQFNGFAASKKYVNKGDMDDTVLENQKG